MYFPPNVSIERNSIRLKTEVQNFPSMDRRPWVLLHSGKNWDSFAVGRLIVASRLSWEKSGRHRSEAEISNGKISKAPEPTGESDTYLALLTTALAAIIVQLDERRRHAKTRGRVCHNKYWNKVTSNLKGAREPKDIGE